MTVYMHMSEKVKAEMFRDATTRVISELRGIHWESDLQAHDAIRQQLTLLRQLDEKARVVAHAIPASRRGDLEELLFQMFVGNEVKWSYPRRCWCVGDCFILLPWDPIGLTPRLLAARMVEALYN